MKEASAYAESRHKKARAETVPRQPTEGSKSTNQSTEDIDQSIKTGIKIYQTCDQGRNQPASSPTDGEKPTNREHQQTIIKHRTRRLSIPLVCVRRKCWHYSGNRHCYANYNYWLFPSVPSGFTGTIAGNRHYSTGTIEGPPLHLYRRRHPPEEKTRA